mmetsp:Transcript_23332/g.55586  ORF Transcript_23332/g.55586 Transcript_23332/m.55586 type:complete len:629 (-) Transcript_23332:123-2009(-)
MADLSLAALLARKASSARDEELLTFAVQALERKAAGDSSTYTELVEALDPAKADATVCVLLVNTLARCTGSLRLKSHKTLINGVLGRGWSGDQALASATELFAINAVSSNAPDLLGPSLSALVHQFSSLRIDLLPFSAAAQAVEEHSGDYEAAMDAAETVFAPAHTPAGSSEEGAPSPEETQKALRVHRALRRVLETVPTGAMTLVELLSGSFPHRRKHVTIQICFLSNLLYVLQYLPHLLKPILSLVVDRLIRIDVEIVPPEALDDHLPGDVFDMDDDEEGGGLSKEAEENRARSEKLDSMFALTLRFVASLLGGIAPMADKEEAFKIVLAVFDADVLTTFRSKFTQFIIFYACTFQYSYVKEFLQALLTKAIEKEHSDRSRVAAAAYLGSFVARFKGMHLSTIRTSLSLLARWVHDYIIAHDHDVTFPDPSVHTVFYSLVQALLYALCFRLQALAEDQNKPSFVPLELRLDRIILSNLNPLKVVNQGVGEMFVTLAVRLRILDEKTLSALLHHNSSFVLPRASEWDEEHSFFPFDPFQLPLSRPFIDPILQGWDGPRAEETDDEESAVQSSRSASVEESIAMSLNSQLSLSDNDHRGSPVWKPMSFSPGRNDTPPTGRGWVPAGPR